MLIMAQILAADPIIVDPSGEPTQLATRGPTGGPGLVLWAIICSTLLAGSAGFRALQSRHYQEENSYTVESPFALKNIPKQVGDWQLVEGSEGNLDPLTTRITGSTDHILANFHNEQTGCVLQVMLLFGPAEPVLPHTPEVCYPATGYKPTEPPVDRPVSSDDKPIGRFRSTIFAKSNGRDLVRETAYYAFRHDGEWVPWVDTKNSPRKNPGIFKIQVARRLTPTENRFQDEPIEDFLAKMVPALEGMIATAKVGRSTEPQAVVGKD